jgi:hypothetical protein
MTKDHQDLLFKVIGALGFILGLANLGWGVWQWRRKYRAVLKVEVSQMQLVTPTGPLRSSPMIMEHALRLRVINHSDFAVKLTSFGFDRKGGDSVMAQSWIQGLPATVAPHDAWEWVIPDKELDLAGVKGLIRVNTSLSRGETFQSPWTQYTPNPEVKTGPPAARGEAS